MLLKHYSHIRMEAKRKALEAIVPKPEVRKTENIDPVPAETRREVAETPKPSPDPIIN